MSYILAHTTYHALVDRYHGNHMSATSCFACFVAGSATANGSRTATDKAISCTEMDKVRYGVFVHMTDFARKLVHPLSMFMSMSLSTSIPSYRIKIKIKIKHTPGQNLVETRVKVKVKVSQCLYRYLLFTRTGQKTPTSMITCTSIHCERIWCDRSIICSSLTIWGFSSIGQWPSGISSTVMPVLMSSTDLTQLSHRHRSDIQSDQVLASSRHTWTLLLGTLQASRMSHVAYRVSRVVTCTYIIRSSST